MKKIIFFAIFVFAVPCFGQGTVTELPPESPTTYPTVRVIFECVGDAATGAFPVTAISAATVEVIAGLYLEKIVTVPGTTAPTALYDIAILETRAGKTYDVVGGALADRSATVAENAVPLIASFGGGVQNLAEAWEIEITNNSVASAGITIELTFSR